MSVNRLKLFYFLLLLLLIAPFGVGIPINFGFKVLDLPKIFTFLLVLIFLYRLRGYVLTKTSLLFGLFIFLHFFSTFYSFNFIGSLINLIGFTLLYYSGYFIMDYFIRNEMILNKVINILKIGFIILASYSVLEFVLGYNPLNNYRTAYLLSNGTSYLNIGLGRIFRASTANYASNLPFAYLLSSLFFLYIVPSFKTPLKNKWYTRFSYIIGVPALFFAQSRAAYIAFTLTLLLSFILRSSISFLKRGVLLISFPIIIILLYGWIGGNIKTYIKVYLLKIEVQKRGDSGLGGRYENNVIDFHYAMQSPVLGHGSGALHHAKSGRFHVLDSSDSSYLLTILADRGIISLILFLFILGQLLYRLYSTGKKRWKLAHYSEAVFYAILVFSLCLNSSQRYESLFFYFALFGIGNRIFEFYKAEKKGGFNYYFHIQ